MRTFGFPQHVFPAVVERDLVLFDAIGDRYVALPGAVSDEKDDAVEVGLTASMLMREAADVLVEGGLLITVQGDEPLPRPSPQPSRMLAVGRPTRAGLIDIARMVAAVRQANQRLKCGLPCRHFTRTRRHRHIVSIRELEAAVGRLREARLRVPHPRRCLPASIVAALFLRGLGHEVEIVFGIRSYPFEAHCWIEADGIVLDDELDRVRSYTPIAVGQL